MCFKFWNYKSNIQFSNFKLNLQQWYLLFYYGNSINVVWLNVVSSDWQIDKLIKEKKNDDWLKNYFWKNKIFITIEMKKIEIV